MPMGSIIFKSISKVETQRKGLQQRRRSPSNSNSSRWRIKMKKPNSLIHLHRNYSGLSVACSTVVKTPASAEAMADKMADVKPDSLNAFKMQGRVSLGVSATQRNSFLTTNRHEFTRIQNRVNFVQERNENHERGHSQERVLGDGISHGSRFVRQLTDQISLVLNAFRRSDRSAWTKADSSVKSVLSVVKTVFSLFVLIRAHWWLKIVLNCVHQCKFAALQPPAKQKWLCLFYSSSLKAPPGFALISGFNFCELPCVLWFKTVFSSLSSYWANKLFSFAFPPSRNLTASLPLGLRLIDRWTNRLLGLNRSAQSRFATVQPISPLASVPSYLAIPLFSYLALSLSPRLFFLGSSIFLFYSGVSYGKY